MRKLACIIGGGVIGGGWVARFAVMGWDVRVFDPDPRAAERIAAVMKGAERALPMLFESPMPTPGRVSYHATLAEAVQGASYIQESVPESLELKVEIFQDIQRHCSCDAVIASSTSSFRPSQLHDGLERPGQLVVAHPFNPVYLLPLVELVQGANFDPYFSDKADEILTGIGMYPLRIRAEIDAHIADRLLEAVWREALWLVKDGLATTQEIDDSIRYGFGLRWAQMGLFETSRIAGGEVGMAHFLEQFGPALKWPWSRLTEVPELDAGLVKTISDQSDAQFGNLGIRDLERARDDNLVAILRALKGQGAAAGKLLKEQDDRLRGPLGDGVPLVTVRRKVPVDWTDSNGHMNEGRYGQVFSDASEALMAHVGADQAYIAAGHSYFTAETNIKYHAETLAGEDIIVETRVALGAGKKLRLLHEMTGPSGDLRATCDQFLLHVSLETRRSCPPQPDVRQRVEALASVHATAR